MKWLSLFCLVQLCSVLQAQGPETYTIKPGEKVYDIIPLKEIYHNPAFVQGSVIFKDGRVAGSRLNYNKLIAAIQFIDAKGDTLSLDEEYTIKYVVLNKDTFCFDKGYIQLRIQNPLVRVGKIEYFQEFEQKQGTYGMASNTSSAINAATIVDKRAFNFNTDHELLLVKKAQYFFGNANEFLPAEKRNVVKLFPKRKKEIIKYLDNTPTNFNNENDLIKLAAFLLVL